MIAIPGSHSHPNRGLWSLAIKVRDIIKLIEQDGWRKVRQAGSHRHYRHPVRLGTVTVAGHLREELHPKTQASIMKQAGLTP